MKRDGLTLVAELERQIGRLSVGYQGTHTLVADDLEVEIVVKVRRRTDADAAATYRAAALAYVDTVPTSADPYPTGGLGVVRQCQGHTARAGWCTARVVAVVVYKPAFGQKETHFRFVCGRHRDKHGVDPKRVLATVELPPSVLAPYRARLAAADAAREAKRIAEDRAEAAARECLRAAQEAIDEAAVVAPAGPAKLKLIH